MLYLKLEHPNDDFPELIDGPFEWIETIDGVLAGLKPGDKEATEIAFLNRFKEWQIGYMGHRIYRRLTIWEQRSGPVNDVWGEDPDPACSREEWRREVVEGNTNLGYWDWVEHNKEATV